MIPSTVVIGIYLNDMTLSPKGDSSREACNTGANDDKSKNNESCRYSLSVMEKPKKNEVSTRFHKSEATINIPA